MKKSLFQPVLSVVIPAWNAEATLDQQLEALALQEVGVPFEVIVADNGSSDCTCERALGWRERFDAIGAELRIIRAAERPGAGHARNAGAVAARGTYLAFVDADDVVAPGWLSAVMEALTTHPFIACRYETATLNPPAVAAATSPPQCHGLMAYAEPAYLPHAGGGGLAIHRKQHEQIGGFDEHYPALEDTDYCWRLQLAGVPLSFAGDAVVRIRLKTKPKAIFQHAFKLARYNVYIYRQYRSDPGRGMPRLGLLPGMFKWGMLVLRAPLTVMRPAHRVRWIWQFGWRLGRLWGCCVYRVAAL